jgi:hypothetical protein
MIKHCPPRAQEKFVKFFTLSEMIQEIPFIRLNKISTNRARDAKNPGGRWILPGDKRRKRREESHL